MDYCCYNLLDFAVICVILKEGYGKVSNMASYWVDKNEKFKESYLATAIIRAKLKCFVQPTDQN